MKRLNIILSICFFIIAGILITVLMTKDTEAKKKPSIYQMECEEVGHRMGLKVQYVTRCENKEVVCYEMGDGVSCLKK